MVLFTTHMICRYFIKFDKILEISAQQRILNDEMKNYCRRVTVRL